MSSFPAEILSLLTALGATLAVVLNLRALKKPGVDLEVRLARIETGIEAIRAELADSKNHRRTIENRMSELETRVTRLEAERHD